MQMVSMENKKRKKESEQQKRGISIWSLKTRSQTVQRLTYLKGIHAKIKVNQTLKLNIKKKKYTSSSLPFPNTIRQCHAAEAEEKQTH